MPKTVENQRVIHINKERYKSNFIQVGIDEIQEVVRNYNQSVVALYLYLCANADGFNLALSQVAFEDAYGYKKTAYYKAFEVLENNGYLVRRSEDSNIYDFFTSPNSAKAEKNIQLPLQRTNNSSVEESSSAVVNKNSSTAIEKQINTYNTQNDIQNDSSSKSEEVLQISRSELQNLAKERNDYNYIVLAQNRVKFGNIVYQITDKSGGGINNEQFLENE